MYKYIYFFLLNFQTDLVKNSESVSSDRQQEY